ncbi:probable E3 ubiquitin-protein ligase TRIML1 [Dromiciops gliroides]|uniref:probable E3 ubiquitin-protein ligase TRIML1 n=1 Tax=Dromiciops gliroides TaxID=33562 RepID=UPI001CC7B1A2|nr:probable E3 ubiquitin-protein ligase TRIML1 [Dromiciops gliroides]
MDINNLFERLKVDLTCSMCLGYFHDPVIVRCGHSFCKECLLSCWKEAHSSVTCPICKSVLAFRAFLYNRRLQNLAIIGKMLRPHLLQSTRVLSSCDKHGKEEIWFCEEDHRPLCGPCFLSTEHKEHKVLPLQRAASQCMEKLQETWTTLKGKKKKFEMELECEKTREAQWKVHGHTLKEQVVSEYEKMHQFFLEEERLQLQRLDKQPRDHQADRESKDSQFQVILNKPMDSEQQPMEMHKLQTQAMIKLFKSQFEKKRKLLSEEKQLHLQRLDQQVKDNLAKFEDSKTKMTEQIHNLEMVMLEIEKTFEEVLMDMLQDAKTTLERKEELLLQNPVAASPRWTMDPIPGMREMLLTFQRDITLDPETANPHLILSDELKSVKYVSVPQDVPDNPKRFDFALRVLATQSFTSGKHYWEVEVENKTEWEVGLCRESIGRKGNVHKQPGDTCSLVAFAFGNTFHLLCSNHPVPLNQPIHKVGIFLDYERGHVAFYNATDGTLIYSPPNDDFQGALWPCFSPCIRKRNNNSGSLRICPTRN